MIEDFFNLALSAHIEECKLKSWKPVGGGCIHKTARLQTKNHSYFIKWNHCREIDLFLTEEKGLQLLNDHPEIRVPGVLGQGQIEEKSYQLLEWIESGYPSSGFWGVFGKSLAKLHQHDHHYFGLSYDNYIGRLHQSNTHHETWHSFFIAERLEPQLKLALSKKLINNQIISLFEKLFPKLENLIPGERPSLLHGDLWSGNFLVDQNSLPVLIDPAVHYGHRETELAFTRLFGGFDKKFYYTYNEEFPLEIGFENRVDIHNLYPLLVHVNLFGSSYLSGIKQTLRRFA
ncbi:MAG: fructosamine kinase family protein [Bacteroidota bacterium]